VEIIASLTPDSAADPLDALASPPSTASLVELRVDLFDGLDVRAAVSACPLPVLATVRSTAEGGRGPVDPESRRTAIARIVEAGTALVDLEFDRDLNLMSTLGLTPEQVVLSWHRPEGTPDDLPDIAAAMLSSSAHLVKLVPTARRLSDLEPLLGLYRAAGKRRHRLLAFAMGTVGIASRYLAPLLGARVAYTAWHASAPAAPGQLTAGQLDRVIGHLNGPPQRLLGVVGRDVSMSLSPSLHGAGYRSEGLPWVMVPVSVPDEAELDALFRPMGTTLFDRVGLAVVGWAVTSPYKQAAAAAATQRAPRVQRADSANTLILRPEHVIAETTDADGVVGSLVSHGIDPAGRNALVQGTGGAARAAAVGLDLAGADVVLRGRDVDRTRSVAERLEVGWCEPDQLPKDTYILVNASPLGSDPTDPSPFGTEEVAGSAAVLDMVYGDHRTQLAELTRATDTRFIDGREMLLHQGYAQFAAFTGRLPPKRAMRSALFDDSSERSR
jgi:3-dehydroquinate dehydratase type I